MLNYLLTGVHDGASMALGGVMAKDDEDAKRKAAVAIKDKLNRMELPGNATITISHPDGRDLPEVSALDLARLV